MATSIQTGTAHHLRLTVTDPSRSREFYELLGFRQAMEYPDGVLVSNGSLLLGLRIGPDATRAQRDDRFDPNRVGLDHLALTVGRRDELDDVIKLCRERGVTCGEVVDYGRFKISSLMLKDPDGIQVELTAPHS